MRFRFVALGALIVVLAVQWSREAGRAIAPPTREGPRDAPAVRPPLAEPPPLPARSRDPFRFEAAPLPTPDTARRPAVLARPRLPTPSARPEPVRLVGFLRRSGRVQAAVALDGEVNLVVAGDRVGGFAVASVDADEGRVRLRGDDGVDLDLTLPDEP
jgi:hypothetical protein